MRFLLCHRNTPPSGTQISPAQRLLNRKNKKYDLLPTSACLLYKPSVAEEDTTYTKLCLRQQQQARYYNRGARNLDRLEKGDAVRFEPWQVGQKEWQKGAVKNRLSERSYEVELPQVHLRKTNEPPATTYDTQHEQCNQPQP